MASVLFFRRKFMKKLSILIILSLFIITGCKDAQNDETKPASDEVVNVVNDDVDNVIAESLETTWKVVGSDTVYVFYDGAGSKDDESFTYLCSVNEYKEILVELTFDADESKELYVITTDNTGYGIYFTSDEKEIYLLPYNIELVDSQEEIFSDLLGVWEDKAGNLYAFEDDFSFNITGTDKEVTAGTFAVIKHVDTGVYSFNLKMDGGSLEYNYEFEDDGDTLKICNDGSDVYHYWNRY